jgi:predicted RNase H-like HicB family nuclease
MKYTIWQDGEFYIGFWNKYPDYQTQGYTNEELIENLKSLLEDLESGEIPCIKKQTAR